MDNRQLAIKRIKNFISCGMNHQLVSVQPLDNEAFEIAIDSMKHDYDRGYKDGEHDGYFSTLISDGREKSHYGLGLKGESDEQTNGD